MRRGRAFPVREAITKVTAVSSILARATHIVVTSAGFGQAAPRLPVALVIEVPLFVTAAAMTVNLLLLDVQLPIVRRVIASLGSRRGRPARPVDRRPDLFGSDPL